MKYPCSANFLNKSILCNLLALLLLLTWGCRQEDDFQRLPSDTPLSLSSVGKGGLQASTGPLSGPSRTFGLFMIPSGASSFNTALASNREYAYTATDINLVGSPIYYPQSGNVGLIAYAPYKNGITGTHLPLDISDQSDIPKIDLLYSNQHSAVNKTSGPVNLTFEHKLSKIRFILKQGDGMSTAELSQLDIRINGFQTQADFNLLTGVLSNQKASAELAIGLAREAIVLPGEAASGRRFEFTLAEQNWTYNVHDIDVFEAGREYHYLITVHAKTIQVERLSIATWEDSGSSTATKPSTIEFVQILPGKFQMGSPGSDQDAKDDEKPQHWRHVDKSFLMSKYLITKQQYCDYLNETNTDYQNPGPGIPVILPKFDSGWKPKTGEENYPMTWITFHDAKNFAVWAGGALPTEVQWEYACRAGTATRWFYGDDQTDYDQYVVPKSTITDVGTKLPNPWGLYDMHGLVAEICYWIDSYPTTPTTEENPIIGIGQRNDSQFDQAIRGNYNGGRSASRATYPMGSKSTYAGFRIVINQE